ncbi:hydroxyisourate hydrolase [Vibrio aquimaris]|uniref:5-hydroxyisourate hydrolase n=1 Tax=Vibrio aquimaris TaxID=2587862 RepID=A0A5P9CQ82_9VIBR|nr:hydroxyisourate hydrolase [Vibrio aquimaris]QFT28418.1 5-hydroxyisourate hydrolase [Vibrio aquimaris]
MTKLTTHVLDTMKGRPAAGIRIEIYRQEDQCWTKIDTVVTNQDGRTDEALLQGNEYKTGKYQLIFYVGEYFAQNEDPNFLDDIVIRFGLSDPTSHMHVPLLVSPYSFSSYRGS